MNIIDDLFEGEDATNKGGVYINACRKICIYPDVKRLCLNIFTVELYPVQFGYKLATSLSLPNGSGYGHPASPSDQLYASQIDAIQAAIKIAKRHYKIQPESGLTKPYLMALEAHLNQKKQKTLF